MKIILVLFGILLCHGAPAQENKDIRCGDSLLAANVAIALTDSTQPTVLYHQGAVLNQLQEYDKALGCFRQALHLLEPDKSQLYACHRGIAEDFYAQRNYTKALVEFEQAESCDSNSIIMSYYIGICHEAEVEYSEAIKSYQRFLTLADKLETINAKLTEMMDDARRRIRMFLPFTV